MTFSAYLRFYLLLWTLCASWRVLRWLVTAAVLIAAALITLVAAVALTGAWLAPARLWRAAAWPLPPPEARPAPAVAIPAPVAQYEPPPRPAAPAALEDAFGQDTR